jgi:hypothetical protein
MVALRPTRLLAQERLHRLAELCLVLCAAPHTLLARQGTALECMVVVQVSGVRSMVYTQVDRTTRCLVYLPAPLHCAAPGHTHCPGPPRVPPAVQSGALQLLHEHPASSRMGRSSAVVAQTLSRTRNGRITAVPMLSTISNAAVPTAESSAAAGAAASAAAAAPAPLGAAPGGAGKTGVAPSGAPGGTGSGMTDVTLHGLLLAEVGAGGVVGEGVLGAAPRTEAGEETESGAAGGTLSGGAPSLAGELGGAGAGGGGGGGTELGGEAAAAAGPRWPATVLVGTAPAVLVVVQRSVLYTVSQGRGGEGRGARGCCDLESGLPALCAA